MVVIVMGLPGSGKSYFAKKLAKSIKAEYVNSDRLRKEFFPNRTYSDAEKATVYDLLLAKQEEAICQKKNLVLDATFHTNETRAPFFVSQKEKIFIIELLADEDIIRQRLQKSRPFSEADFDVYQSIRRQWEPLLQPHLVLQSTNENSGAMLQRAIEYLRDESGADK